MSTRSLFTLSRRTVWGLLAVWAVVLAVAVPVGSQLFGSTQDDQAAFLPRDADSTAAIEAQRRLPGGEAQLALVAYHRPGGLTPSDLDVIDGHGTMLASVDASGRPPPTVVAEDGEAAFLPVAVSTHDVPDVGDALIAATRSIRDTVHGNGVDGLETAVTGPAALTADSVEVFDDLEVALVVVPVIVVALLLLLIYRSPVLLVIPLASVVAANQLGSAVVYGLAERFGLTVNSLAVSVLGILIYGVGTDYALLIVSRYREELGRHADRFVAMRRAITRCGPAILASAATSSLGLLCLLAADLNSTRATGPVAAIAVLAALVAMVTLLPTLLLVVGRWVFWPFIPRPTEPDDAAVARSVPGAPIGDAPPGGGTVVQEQGGWWRLGRVLAHRPRAAWLATTALLVVFVAGLATMSSPQQTLFRSPLDSIRGQELVSAHFDAGAARPVSIIAPEVQATEVARAVARTPGVASIDELERGDGLVGFSARLDATPSSPKEHATIQRLRSILGELAPEDGGAAGDRPLIGGPAALEVDLHDTNRRDASVVIPLTLLVILGVLIVLLRAVVAPLILIATQILSFGAALGLSAVVFEHGFGWRGQDAALPVLTFVFLIALGVDYSIFLVTRIHEEATSVGTRAGVVRGLAFTGGVITSAGIVLAATFTVLASLPVVLVAQLGFVVAVGILIDTMVIRSILVPALALDLGHRIWWPRALAADRAAAKAHVDWARDDTQAVWT